MADTADKGPDYPIANQLDVAIKPVEDRVVLIAGTKGHGRRGLLLTRRLMKSLLGQYAQVLERTSETAAQAAAGHKAEVLQMEHVAARSQGEPDGGEGGRAGGESEQQVSAVYLATGVHCEPRDSQILLAFDGVRRDVHDPNATTAAPALAFVLDRTTAHKVLAMLQDKADEAGWDLAKPSGWTDRLQPATASEVN